MSCVWSVIPGKYGIVRAYKGDEVKLPCHVTPATATNVTWLHTDDPTSSAFFVLINGQIDDRLRWRFSIYNATVLGDYSLHIQNIQPADAGLYQCYNQRHLLQNYTVFVLG